MTTPTKRQGPSEEAQLKGGLSTLHKLGVSHYQLMGKRSAEVRRIRKELQAILAQIDPDHHSKEANEATTNQNQ